MASRKIIYIVDDQDDYRFLLKQLFSQLFPAYLVCFFNSGQALLKQLPDLPANPDLILLDCHMPDFDGNQTLRSLKGHPAYRTIPVVMMSAAASAAEIKVCYENGTNSFVMKEMNYADLKARLETICQYWLDINYA